MENYIKKRGTDFSLVKKLNEYIRNADWQAGLNDAIDDIMPKDNDGNVLFNDAPDYSALWYSLSSLFEHTHSQAYSKTVNLTTNVVDIEYCNFNVLESIATYLGIDNFRTINLEFPPKLLNLLEVFSINYNNICRKDKVLTDLSLEYVLSGITNTIDVHNDNNNIMEGFIPPVSGNFTYIVDDKYLETMEQEISACIIDGVTNENIVSGFFTEIYASQNFNTRSILATPYDDIDIEILKIDNEVPITFFARQETDNIIDNKSSIYDYNDAEILIINAEIDNRQRYTKYGIKPELPRRFQYEKERRVRKYIKFIEYINAEYQDVHIISNILNDEIVPETNKRFFDYHDIEVLSYDNFIGVEIDTNKWTVTDGVTQDNSFNFNPDPGNISIASLNNADKIQDNFDITLNLECLWPTIIGLNDYTNAGLRLKTKDHTYELYIEKDGSNNIYWKFKKSSELLRKTLSNIIVSGFLRIKRVDGIIYTYHSRGLINWNKFHMPIDDDSDILSLELFAETTEDNTNDFTAVFNNFYVDLSYNFKRPFLLNLIENIPVSGEMITNATHILRNMCVLTAYQREEFKSSVLKHQKIGTAAIYKYMIPRYISKEYSNPSDWRLYDLVSRLEDDNIFSKINTLASNLHNSIEIVEYNDKTPYHNIMRIGGDPDEIIIDEYFEDEPNLRPQLDEPWAECSFSEDFKIYINPWTIPAEVFVTPLGPIDDSVVVEYPLNSKIYYGWNNIGGKVDILSPDQCMVGKDPYSSRPEPGRYPFNRWNPVNYMFDGPQLEVAPGEQFEVRMWNNSGPMSCEFRIDMLAQHTSSSGTDVYVPSDFPIEDGVLRSDLNPRYWLNDYADDVFINNTVDPFYWHSEVVTNDTNTSQHTGAEVNKFYKNVGMNFDSYDNLDLFLDNVYLHGAIWGTLRNRPGQTPNDYLDFGDDGVKLEFTNRINIINDILDTLPPPIVPVITNNNVLGYGIAAKGIIDIGDIGGGSGSCSFQLSENIESVTKVVSTADFSTGSSLITVLFTVPVIDHYMVNYELGLQSGGNLDNTNELTSVIVLNKNTLGFQLSLDETHGSIVQNLQLTLKVELFNNNFVPFSSPLPAVSTLENYLLFKDFEAKDEFVAKIRNLKTIIDASLEPPPYVVEPPIPIQTYKHIIFNTHDDMLTFTDLINEIPAILETLLPLPPLRLPEEKYISSSTYLYFGTDDVKLLQFMDNIQAIKTSIETLPLLKTPPPSTVSDLYLEVFNKYGGLPENYTPWNYYNNNIHPSFAPLPYIWNLSEIVNTNLKFDNLYDDYQINNYETIGDILDTWYNEDGSIIDRWKYETKYNMDSYLDEYQYSRNIDINFNENEKRNFDGPFYTEALSDYLANVDHYISDIERSHSHIYIEPQLITKMINQLNIHKQDIIDVGGQNIYQYSLDKYGNQYTLFKDDDKRSTPGTLWLRYFNHLLSFPIIDDNDDTDYQINMKAHITNNEEEYENIYHITRNCMDFGIVTLPNGENILWIYGKNTNDLDEMIFVNVVRSDRNNLKHYLLAKPLTCNFYNLILEQRFTQEYLDANPEFEELCSIQPLDEKFIGVYKIGDHNDGSIVVVTKFGGFKLMDSGLYKINLKFRTYNTKRGLKISNKVVYSEYDEFLKEDSTNDWILSKEHTRLTIMFKSYSPSQLNKDLDFPFYGSNRNGPVDLKYNEYKYGNIHNITNIDYDMLPSSHDLSDYTISHYMGFNHASYASLHAYAGWTGPLGEYAHQPIYRYLALDKYEDSVNIEFIGLSDPPTKARFDIDFFNLLCWNDQDEYFYLITSPIYPVWEDCDFAWEDRIADFEWPENWENTNFKFNPASPNWHVLYKNEHKFTYPGETKSFIGVNKNPEQPKVVIDSVKWSDCLFEWEDSIKDFYDPSVWINPNMIDNEYNPTWELDEIVDGIEKLGPAEWGDCFFQWKEAIHEFDDPDLWEDDYRLLNENFPSWILEKLTRRGIIWEEFEFDIIYHGVGCQKFQFKYTKTRIITLSIGIDPRGEDYWMQFE